MIRSGPSLAFRHASSRYSAISSLRESSGMRESKSHPVRTGLDWRLGSCGFVCPLEIRASRLGFFTSPRAGGILVRGGMGAHRRGAPARPFLSPVLETCERIFHIARKVSTAMYPADGCCPRCDRQLIHLVTFNPKSLAWADAFGNGAGVQVTTMRSLFRIRHRFW